MFSVSGGFAAATSGSLFAIIGVFLQNQDVPHGYSDGNEEQRGEEGLNWGIRVDVQDSQEVAVILDDIVSIYSVD